MAPEVREGGEALQTPQSVRRGGAGRPETEEEQEQEVRVVQRQRGRRVRVRRYLSGPWVNSSCPRLSTSFLGGPSAVGEGGSTRTT